MDEQHTAMGDAILRMAEHRAKAVNVDRRNWTDAQWVNDAERLMSDVDGSVTSLVNGHVLALVRRVRELEKCAEGGPAAVRHSFAEIERWVLVGGPTLEAFNGETGETKFTGQFAGWTAAPTVRLEVAPGEFRHWRLDQVREQEGGE